MPTTDKNYLISEKIIRIMRAKKISQADLASRLGVTQATISKTLHNQRGNSLTDEYVRRICRALDVEYKDVISVSPEIQLANENLERGIIMWLLNKKGIETAHVIVSCSVVYRSDLYSNYNYTTDGITMYTPEQMKLIVQEDQETLKRDGIDDIDDYFDEYYEMTYHNKTKKYTVQDYNSLLEMFSVQNQNMINAVFDY